MLCIVINVDLEVEKLLAFLIPLELRSNIYYADTLETLPKVHLKESVFMPKRGLLRVHNICIQIDCSQPLNLCM